MARVFLKRYEVVRPIGEGGMGQVFLGRDRLENREVVIKVMHKRFADDPKFRKAFQREMLTMTRFRHPFAVELFEASMDGDSQPCIVMEYVPGKTLSEMIQEKGRLAPVRFAPLLGQLCQVLQAAHDNGVIHRDLTPANVMVMRPETASECVKVMDFGLARIGVGPYIPLEKLTGEGDSIGGGTPDYVSPEQLRREEVDHRADIYSLGVLMFKVLTGYLPFEEATTTAAILDAHLHKQPPRFRDFGLGGVSAQVEAVVLSCLAKLPKDRPQTALEVAERFGHAIGQRLIIGKPIPAVMLPARQPERKDWVIRFDEFDAFMPESIAVLKLRGFAGDIGGEIVDSEPGVIRLQVTDPFCKSDASKSWFALWKKGKANGSRRNTIVELGLEKASRQSRDVLRISVMMVPGDPVAAAKPDWKDWANQLCRELRAYLISR